MQKKSKAEVRSILIIFLFGYFFLPLFSFQKANPELSQPVYDFVIETTWLTMKDGIRLSATLYKPVPRIPQEKFPVILEYLPYRKDDESYSGTYAKYTYFVRRGFIMASVDIRGTGSSEGTFPLREYSEEELEDALEVIDQLSKLPESNGNVGMWGISWGGFNSIQVAMRRPPALKAILAAMATDDLFHDDIHYIDGAFHVDEWAFWFDHAKALPATPDYLLNDEYFENRFNSYPGLLTYLKQQKDGDFWRKNSLRWQYDRIQIPCYLIGGLLDGYRDSIPRMLEKMKVPLKAVMGPYNHSWPDDGVPGPNYEWRHEAVRWWDQWLKGKETGILDEPRFILFIREAHPPDPELEITPGYWISGEWPIPETTWKKFYPSQNSQLLEGLGKEGIESLRYIPTYGIATGLWWGEATDDMRPDDAGSLVFSSQILEEEFVIAGFPRVFLRVSADAPLAHWVARLEDVWPDGRVSLVTGALLNSSQRNSRLEPEPLKPFQEYDLEFEMHFTTWTFKKGHRIRVSVSNSLFPMIWPTPHQMTTKLYLGTENTRIELPVIPSHGHKKPSLLPPEPREARPDCRDLGGGAWPKGFYEWRRDLWKGVVSVEWRGWSSYEIENRRYHSTEKNYYQTNEKDPARSLFLGEASNRIELPGRTIYLLTKAEISSDSKYFYVTFTREIYENEKFLRRKEWKEKIERFFN